MNDFLAEIIFKNCEKIRSKNQLEEKLLKQKIDGHQGYKKKLK